MFSVSELTGLIKNSLETNFSSLCVVGQISNVSRPMSGHVYLTLKDDGAQMPAVIWKSTAARLKFNLKDGQELVCRGHIDVFPPQGKYQLIVTSAEPRGIGTLELAFRQLHEKLAADGLFDARRKKTIPRFIRRVALITSPSGAAIRDFLQVLRRRTQQIDVLILPVRVQGEGAAEEIAVALKNVHRIANRFDSPIDVCVLTRGGGSVEDLWTFNEEILVRAVASSEIPVVSAIGHEIDVTLCDLAADVRALTPSEAAERISVEDTELFANLRQFKRLIDDSMTARLKQCREKLTSASKQSVFARPMRITEDRQGQLQYVEERLERNWQNKMESAKSRFQSASAALEALSPLSVLARGYSLTKAEKNGRLLISAADVKSGEMLLTQLKDGTVKSRVI